MLEISPPIKYNEIIKFNKKFKDADFFKPELCDSLISVKNTIYKKNVVLDDDHQTLIHIKNKRDSIHSSIEIEDFVKSYIEKNTRKPSVEEIYDNLEDKINKICIDNYVSRMNLRINND